MRYRRGLLAFVLGAIAVTAVLGLYAVLVPDFGELQAKILGTSAAISGTSVVLLALTPAWERRLLRPLPVAGALVAVTALVLGLIGLWSEIESDVYGKLEGTLIFLAAWALLTCLLVLATLPRRYRWVFLVAVGLTLCLVAVGVASLWLEPDSTAVGRLAGALAVLSAAFVLTVPVLHRASRTELAAASIIAEVAFCPRCGAPMGPSAAGGDPVVCHRCGARFRVVYLDA